ncbi:phosphoserine phosphatase, chloroplastic, partial [Haematococcus lacustris]
MLLKTRAPAVRAHSTLAYSLLSPSFALCSVALTQYSVARAPGAPPRSLRTGRRAQLQANATENDSGQGRVTGYAPKTSPHETHKALWRRADAVCFDVDCTITTNDSLDLLAAFMGVKDEVEALTNRAMDGSLNLEEALDKRLEIINCTPADIKRFIQAHPPSSRMTPGVERLVAALQARGVQVYLISGGFRELTLPIAQHLGIPKHNVFANRMNWQWDDETGEPTRLVGFDIKEPTAHNQGKPQAIARIRQKYPYNNVVMIGDGITDLEAVQ